MKKAQALKEKLKPGQVYRRGDLAQWSNAVDRHLKQLQADGTLIKLSGGLYYYPKKTDFGDVPPKDEALVQAFLKDHRFLLTSPNAYNALGLGTTQLYNETVVYNHKRHGRFNLGGRVFDFRIRPHFPAKLTLEFLLVDVVNNLDRLAKAQGMILERLQQKAKETDQKTLSKAALEYGNIKTRKFFQSLIEQS